MDLIVCCVVSSKIWVTSITFYFIDFYILFWDFENVFLLVMVLILIVTALSILGWNVCSCWPNLALWSYFFSSSWTNWTSSIFFSHCSWTLAYKIIISWKFLFRLIVIFLNLSSPPSSLSISSEPLPSPSSSNIKGALTEPLDTVDFTLGVAGI